MKVEFEVTVLEIAIGIGIMIIAILATILLIMGIPPLPSDDICTSFEGNWGTTYNGPISHWVTEYPDFYRSFCTCRADYVCIDGYDAPYCYVERCSLKNGGM